MREVKGTLKIVPKKRRELLSWFASQSQDIQLKICKTKSVTLATWRSKYKEQTVTTTVEQAELASLLDAILKIRRDLQGGKTEKAFEVRLLEAKKKTKERKAPASTVIAKNYLDLIHLLRTEGLSWRRVQSYIKTHHRKSFAFSTLRSTYVSEYGSDAK